NYWRNRPALGWTKTSRKIKPSRKGESDAQVDCRRLCSDLGVVSTGFPILERCGADSVTTVAAKQTWKKSAFVGLLMLACCSGTARAQSRPSDPAASQSPNFAVEGVALGSKVKADSSAYREYKCAPSEQFDGFTWCTRSRRDSERQGSFEAIYSIL